MTTEEKFNAAVNVIRSLPKNGSYQPSNELMLRFYAYFKQATLGSCSGSRPAFWDVVGRAKYDSWKKLGDMSKNDAMTKYVDELHAIVETMSYSDKVANFLEAPTNELEGISFDDLELIAGDVLEKVRSIPNSPLASREGSPIRFNSSLSSSRSISPSIPTVETDHSDDEYIDTIEIPEPKKPTLNESSRQQKTTLIPNGGIQHMSRTRTRSQSDTVDISQEISKTVESLKADVLRLTNQMNKLETSHKKVLVRRKGFFTGLPSKTIAFMIIWPFVASFIMNKWVVRRK